MRRGKWLRFTKSNQAVSGVAETAFSLHSKRRPEEWGFEPLAFSIMNETLCQLSYTQISCSHSIPL